MELLSAMEAMAEVKFVGFVLANYFMKYSFDNAFCLYQIHVDRNKGVYGNVEAHLLAKEGARKKQPMENPYEELKNTSC